MNATKTLVLPVPTRLGVFTARYSQLGLAALEFPSKRPAADGNRPAGTTNTLRGWHKLTCEALEAATAGRAPGALPPLDWSAATSFQKTVWNALRSIPPGKTRSYGEVARTLKKPRAARAVGAACGANPIPVLVPCHRVLAAGGALGGFSGGLDWKQKLLELETPPSEMSRPGRRRGF